MNTNFVTFYLIIVAITGPFFQVMPIPYAEKLLWSDILLGKVLNQVPTIFLVLYILFKTEKKTRSTKIFILLVLFLSSCIFLELYYYLVATSMVFITVVVHNTLSNIILMLIFYLKSKNVSIYDKKVFIYAFLLASLVTLLFSYSLYSIYITYFESRIITFFILTLFIITTIALVFCSFFAEKPFQRTWYEITIGVFLMIIVDIYTFSCIFAFETPPNLLFTVGKVCLSLGLLLLSDGILRKRLSYININE